MDIYSHLDSNNKNLGISIGAQSAHNNRSSVHCFDRAEARERWNRQCEQFEEHEPESTAASPWSLIHSTTEKSGIDEPTAHGDDTKVIYLISISCIQIVHIHFLNIIFYPILIPFVCCSPRASTVGRPGGLRAPQPSPYSGPPAPSQHQNKNSVLDKFKLFNNKEKNQERGKASSAVSKRTSSSSGFSSARSEHSDSSTSLCDQSKSQVESPKTRALKSKLQAKPAKQASPKSARKEQTKAQSKIARTKAPEKLAYPPSPLDDAKTGSKIANAGAKVVDKKVNNFDLLKQSSQLQKSNSVLAPPGHQKQQSQQQFLQETKTVTTTRTDQKSIQRPKMELPGKITDPKINQQNHKGPPNGLSKDVHGQKGLTPNSNGLIKLPANEVQSHIENPGGLENVPIAFENTITTMNQANINLSEEKMVETVDKSANDGNLYGFRSDDYDASVKGCDNHIGAFEANHQGSLNDNKTQSGDVKVPENSESLQMESPSSQACKIAPVNGSPLPGPGQNSQGQTSTCPGVSPGSSIPKPTALVKGTTKQQKEINIPNIPNAAKLKGDSLHRKLDPNTVAMVSPMPSISDLMSESSHSNSNSTGQSNSSDSSVIYRPSSESGSEIKTIPNRKIDTTFEQMEKVSKFIFYPRLLAKHNYFILLYGIQGIKMYK